MRFRITLFSLILLVPSFILSGSITHTFHFSREGYSFSIYNGYDVLTMRNGVSNTEVGKPSIPFVIANFVIPATAEVTEVVVISKETEELPGVYDICPVQTPRPFSSNEYVPFVEPDPGIYNSSNEFPEKDIVTFPSGSMSGYRIAGIYVNPVKYIPNEKRLIITTELTVCISYSEGANEAVSLTSKQRDVFGRGVGIIVLNKDDIERFSPSIKQDSRLDVNYAIITNSTLATDWQKLADWKIAAGYTAQVFTTDWIYSNYTGYYDNQESIRSFLTDYFTNNGLIYAVLGGDVQIVPERDVYTVLDPPPNWIAADYYYSDLDGNWDSDGDHKYGELVDGVDGYSDIYVGRPPVDNATDINSFLIKDSVYIYSPPAGCIQKLLLPSEQLWAGYHGRITNNLIGDMFPGWTVTKLEDLSPPHTRNAFNENYNLMHIQAHGNSSGTSLFANSDVPYLTNTMPTIMNSIACYSGDFDGTGNCFAEQLLNKSGGAGCVAVMMNSRYGYGTPPSMGPSEELDTTFFSILLKDTLHIGMIHAAVKCHYRNPIWSSALWHFCGTEINLFGDPEMIVRLAPANEPYIYISDKVLADNNTNGIWEPGEYAGLTVTLNNAGGVTGTNVQAVLRAITNGQYVNIADSTSSFADIVPGGFYTNTLDPYDLYADVGAPDGTEIGFTLHITADGGFSWDKNFTYTIGNAPQDYCSHDIGNVKFTVTNCGICGFTNDGQLFGSGFKYPKTGAQHLFVGSVWAGNSASYVVNRDFSDENSGDWETVGGLWDFDTLCSEQDSWAEYDDAGMSSPKNLTCVQLGWAWSDPGHEDYIIMWYRFKNEGTSAIDNLYFGQFMDWDLGDAYSNSGEVDTLRNLIVMFGSGTKYVGVGLLDPSTSANITFIKNETYVYPNAHILDSHKIQFLDGSLSFHSASSWMDWSICVSAGPVNLSPGDSTVFAVVILGGEDLADIQANCDSAQARYPHIGVEEKPDGSTEPPALFSISKLYPQPFSSMVTIEYTVPRESSVSLRVYDVCGRLVKTIINKKHSPGIYRAKWDGKTKYGNKGAAGVYFCRLVVNGNEQKGTKKLLFVK